MKKKNNKIKVISNFNIKIFENILIKNNFDLIKSNFENIYNQIQKLKKLNLKAIILLLDLETLIPNFNFISKNNTLVIKKEIKILSNFILKNVNKSTKVYCINFRPKDTINNYNYSDQTNLGLKNFLYNEANYFFQKNMVKNKNTIFVHTNNFAGKIVDEKKWLYLKSLYTNDYYNFIVESIKNRQDEVKRIKLIILDLDNTIWGGTIGDLGWSKIRLGGIDPIGEAYKKFQYKIKELKNKGVVLAICSKNFEKNAFKVFQKNKEMILTLRDFVDTKINWNNKSLNIKDTLKKLNLRPEDCLFIDDNQVEIDEVKSKIKSINTLKLPLENLEFADILDKIKRLNFLPLTKEDFSKTKLYKDEIKRNELKINNTDDDNWKKSLKMELTKSSINYTNIGRVEQLFAKTNQINLSNIRKDEKKVFADIKNKSIFHVFELKDKFGSSGIIAITSHKIIKKTFIIEDFIMSCRVFGRDIEFAILNFCINIFSNNKLVENLEVNFKNNKYNDLMKNILMDYFSTSKNFIINKKFKSKKINVNRFIKIK